MSQHIFIPSALGFDPTSHSGDFCTLHRGDLGLRLAQNPQEVEAAQSLRAHVFFADKGSVLPNQTHNRERGQAPTQAQEQMPEQMREEWRDADAFDEICDHLIMTTRHPLGDTLMGTRLATGETVIGCYRLLRRSVATMHGGFYSAAEFNLDPMLKQTADADVVELGRSCIAPAYRARQTLDFLWQGISAYVRHYDIGALMGCASFMGTNPDDFAMPLSYLHHFHAATAPWQVRAHDRRYMPMNYLPPEAIDAKRALREMSPVLRGYVRMGCLVGDGAVIDHEFGSVDVFVIFPLSEIADRYRRRYLSAA